MIVAGITPPGGWNSGRATFVHNGMRICCGVATLFDNGCIYLTAGGSNIFNYRVWCCRGEPWWDDRDMKFAHATVHRMIWQLEEKLGKALTFTLPPDVVAEIRTARAAKYQGEGI